MWDARDRYQTTGDEPHYLVAGRSLEHFHSLEMTDAYQEEFTRHLYYPPQFPAAPGSEPDQSTGAHVTHQRDGYFMEHGLGLPALIALPSEWFGPTGARIALIILASGIVLLAWFAGGFFFDGMKARFVATLVTSVALPFATAANQIYPDLPGGLACGVAVLACTAFVLRGWTARSAVLAGVASLALAWLPWFHNRFAATAWLLAAALAWFAFRALLRNRSWRRSAVVAVLLPIPTLVSTILWLDFYAYAFNVSPFAAASNQMEVSWTSFMVLLGLHFDRLQGIFIQNPLLLLGPVGIVLLAARSRVLAVLIALTYASLVVPTAMQRILYGGQSFGGRFAWAGAVVLIIPTMEALARLRVRSVWLFRAACTAMPILQAWFLYRVVFGNLVIYNQARDTVLEAYPSWLPGPALYNDDWAPGFRRNWMVPIVAIGMMIALVVWLWPRAEDGIVDVDFGARSW